MPDWLLYLQAFVASAGVSAVFVLGSGWLLRPATAVWTPAMCVLGIGIGLGAGYFVLQFSFKWPPANGLERLLEIVLPVAMGVELVAGLPWVSRRLAWFLRLGLSAVIGRILLHGSVYLSDRGPEWTATEAVATLLGCSVLLAITWALLEWLAQRSSGVSIAVALGMATQCAGVTVMLAGYLKGGAAAWPLSAAIGAAAIASRPVAKRSSVPSAIGIGVVGLFGLLFIGRFFGGLRSTPALLTFLAPLLCWATEIPQLRKQKPWRIGAIRLVLVAILLVVVLVVAKLAFDRDMAPWLTPP